MSADNDRKTIRQSPNLFSPEKVMVALEAHLSLPNDPERERKLVTELSYVVGLSEEDTAADTALCVLRNSRYDSIVANTAALTVMGLANKILNLYNDKPKAAQLANEVVIFVGLSNITGVQADELYQRLEPSLGPAGDNQHYSPSSDRPLRKPSGPGKLRPA